MPVFICIYVELVGIVVVLYCIMHVLFGILAVLLYICLVMFNIMHGLTALQMEALHFHVF
jgi:hypothetical protein